MLLIPRGKLREILHLEGYAAFAVELGYEWSQRKLQSAQEAVYKDYPYMIIEYVLHGDLLVYFRGSRGVSDCYYDDPDIKPMTKLTSEQMLKFAWQISDGMRYISSKKIIYRDPGARNVLVGENHTCQITEFGMPRNVEEIYVRRSEGRIPVKWTVIEAMTGAMKYSTKSDVWSFGVVLYEICTIGIIS